jgi:hypothetical protein
MASSTCPHGCRYCKMLEAGASGPFTPAQFVEVFGVVNQPEPRDRSPELVDAENTRDGAQSQYEAANQAVADLWPFKDADQDELAEANRQRDRASKQLVQARLAAQDIARREQHERQRAEYLASLPPDPSRVAVPVD